MSVAQQQPTRSPIAKLHPASFALVMATGIVSVASQLRGLPEVAVVLLWLNVFFAAALWIMTLWRIVRYRREFVADLFDHNRCVGFFTCVAAMCVMGNQFVIVVDRPQVAVALWFVGLVLWFTLTYTIFTILTVKKDKPPLDKGLNGGWLVTVVAAQSVSALGALVAARIRHGAGTGHVRVPGDVARGWHALHLDYRAHILPLHLFPPRSKATCASVLDQHGGDGNFHSGRRRARGERSGVQLFDGITALYQRSYLALLGNCYVVDSAACDVRHLAPSALQSAVALRRRVLERCFPAWNVHGMHASTRPSDRSNVFGCDSTILHFHRLGGWVVTFTGLLWRIARWLRGLE